MIHTKTNYTCASLMRKAKKGDIIFDTPLQRGYVWDYVRKSLLIHSILVDYAVPQFFVRKVDSKYEVFDGKQRYSAISEFIENKYALRGIPNIQFHGEDYVLNRKKYAELPKELQEIISGYSLDFQVFDDVTDEQIADMFFRLNNGKILKEVDLIKSQSSAISEINKLRKHKLFSDFFSIRQIANSADVELIMKTWMILFDDSRNLMSKNISSQMKEAEFSEDQVVQINQVFDYLDNVLEMIQSRGNKLIINKLFKKSAMVSVVYAINVAIKNCTDDKTFSKWCEQFFAGNEASSNEKYNSNVTSGGLSKPRSINERFSIIENDLLAFIK